MKGESPSFKEFTVSISKERSNLQGFKIDSKVLIDQKINKKLELRKQKNFIDFEKARIGLNSDGMFNREVIVDTYNQEVKAINDQVRHHQNFNSVSTLTLAEIIEQCASLLPSNKNFHDNLELAIKIFERALALIKEREVDVQQDLKDFLSKLTQFIYLLFIRFPQNFKKSSMPEVKPLIGEFYYRLFTCLNVIVQINENQCRIIDKEFKRNSLVPSIINIILLPSKTFYTDYSYIIKEEIFICLGNLIIKEDKSAIKASVLDLICKNIKENTLDINQGKDSEKQYLNPFSISFKKTLFWIVVNLTKDSLMHLETQTVHEIAYIVSYYINTCEIEEIVLNSLWALSQIVLKINPEVKKAILFNDVFIRNIFRIMKNLVVKSDHKDIYIVTISLFSSITQFQKSQEDKIVVELMFSCNLVDSLCFLFENSGEDINIWKKLMLIMFNFTNSLASITRKFLYDGRILSSLRKVIKICSNSQVELTIMGTLDHILYNSFFFMRDKSLFTKIINIFLEKYSDDMKPELINSYLVFMRKYINTIDVENTLTSFLDIFKLLEVLENICMSCKSVEKIEKTAQGLYGKISTVYKQHLFP